MAITDMDSVVSFFDLRITDILYLLSIIPIGLYLIPNIYYGIGILYIISCFIAGAYGFHWSVIATIEWLNKDKKNVDHADILFSGLCGGFAFGLLWPIVIPLYKISNFYKQNYVVKKEK